MLKPLFISITYTIQVPDEDLDQVAETYGRAHTLILNLLGARDIHIMVQKQPKPYPDLSQEKDGW